MRHPVASKQILDLIAWMIAEDVITAESIDSIVMVLDDIATLAGEVTEKRRTGPLVYVLPSLFGLDANVGIGNKTRWWSVDVWPQNYCLNFVRQYPA